MSLVYVFTASNQEGRPAEQIADWRKRQPWGRGTGALGSTRSSLGPESPLDRKPDAVLIIGLCGALSSSLPETRIVAYTGCLSAGPNKPPLHQYTYSPYTYSPGHCAGPSPQDKILRSKRLRSATAGHESGFGAAIRSLDLECVTVFKNRSHEPRIPVRSHENGVPGGRAVDRTEAGFCFPCSGQSRAMRLE